MLQFTFSGYSDFLRFFFGTENFRPHSNGKNLLVNFACGVAAYVVFNRIFCGSTNATRVSWTFADTGTKAVKNQSTF